MYHWFGRLAPRTLRRRLFCALASCVQAGERTKQRVHAVHCIHIERRLDSAVLGAAKVTDSNQNTVDEISNETRNRMAT